MREMMMSNPEWNNDDSLIDVESFGTPDAETITGVDVAAAIATERAAMQVHETGDRRLQPCAERCRTRN